ncbi:MAG: hypothetical protein RR645_07230, partial [Clostridium sp.]
LIFALIGLIGGVFLGAYQVSIATEEMKQQMISQLGSIKAIIAVSVGQSTLLAFFSAFIGLKLARKTNLKLNFKFDKHSIV